MKKILKRYLVAVLCGTSLLLTGCANTPVKEDVKQTEETIEKDVEHVENDAKEKDDAVAEEVKGDLDEKEMEADEKETLRELLITVDEPFDEGDSLAAAQAAAARMLICEGKYDVLDKGIYFKQLIEKEDFDGITGKGVALYKTGVMTKLAKLFDVTEKDIREAFIDPENATPSFDMDYYQYYMVNPDFDEEHVLDGIPEVTIKGVSDEGEKRLVSYSYNGNTREGTLKKNAEGQYVLISVAAK